MVKPIINIEDIALEPWRLGSSLPEEASERYNAKIGLVGPRIGAQRLGYNITAVPSGKSAFPLHNHHVNEEMFFILQGHGELRMGEQSYSIRSGDFIACPPGGKEMAHKLINTGKDELRYLAVSTKISPEIVDYPDSGKFGVLEEPAIGPDGQPKRFVYIGRQSDSGDYWDGE